MRNVGAAALGQVVAGAARHEQRIRAGDEIAGDGIEPVQPLDRARLPQRRPRLASLDILGAIAETLLDGDRDRIGVDAGDDSIGAISPPGDQIEAENPNPAALMEAGARGIARSSAARRCAASSGQASRQTRAFPSERSPEASPLHP